MLTRGKNKKVVKMEFGKNGKWFKMEVVKMKNGQML